MRNEPRIITLSDELSDTMVGELKRRLLQLQRATRELEDVSAMLRELACELPASDDPGGLARQARFVCAGGSQARLLLSDIERVCGALDVLADLRSTELDFERHAEDDDADSD